MIMGYMNMHGNHHNHGGGGCFLVGVHSLSLPPTLNLMDHSRNRNRKIVNVSNNSPYLSSIRGGGGGDVIGDGDVAFGIRSRISSSSSTTSTHISLSKRTESNQSMTEEEEAAQSTTTKSTVSKLKSKLNRDFLAIAIPAFVQLAAEPLAGLVDTAYLGRLGPEVLGGAGVAISAQYAVSKLYNDPLLRTSISLVASQDGKSRKQNNDNINNTNDNHNEQNDALTSTTKSTTSTTASGETANSQNEELGIAISSALLLALAVGTIQLLVYSTLAPTIVQTMMGVPSTSTMYQPATSYLRVRAFGTPAATLWLVTNGIFRGLGDTRTPLIYSLAFTALNALLDPFFIFTMHMGASGAALGTLLAQYMALGPLLFALNRKNNVTIDLFGQMDQLKDTLLQYLQAGGYVLFRTLGKVLAYAACARQAAILGPVMAAAYNLTFQLGFATTQICEAVAVSVQTLLARELADKGDEDDDHDDTEPIMDNTNHTPSSSSNHHPIQTVAVRHLIRQSITIGGIVAFALSILTYLQQHSVMASLTSDVAVQTASIAIFPVVLITQVLKGLAYPVNGIIMGGLDWKFTMGAMWVANAVCLGVLYLGNGTAAAPISLERIWWALAAFMGTQVVTGVARFLSGTGPWKIVRRGSTTTKSSKD
eukprot:CAMPEP_0184862522 /NCGR_PEP_ID=MMETSP0580-20130426/6985_1 /TAXON_ID=1118495 /ORGANISM="Dactyliosolen fragilissimus" /LENGTH=649 /DNA_ID=CAMNT_0027360441 /DNA_START=89 /DNA_END=2038 /DNA_ORIENTATION=-